MPVTGIEVAQVACDVLVKCVQAYQIIDDAIKKYTKAPDEAQEFSEEIQIGIVRIQNIATVLFKRGIIEILQDANAHCVLNILKRLERILHKYGDWVVDANFEDDTPVTEATGSPLPGNSAVLAISEYSSIQEMYKAINKAVQNRDQGLVFYKKQFGNWKRFKWMVRDSSKLKTFKEDIQRWTERLQLSLPPIVLQTAGLDIERVTLLSQENLRCFPGLTEALKRMSFTLNLQTLPTSIDCIEVNALTESSDFPFGQNSRLMNYNSEKVFVELKVCPPSRENEKPIDNILGLAALLKDGSKSQQLNVLECLGCVHEPRHSRAQLVFKIPSTAGRQADLIALSSLMPSLLSRSNSNLHSSWSMNAAVGVNSEHTIPGLDERFELIQALARTVMLLHSEGWLHKSIRSDNIVFPHYNRKINFSKPYLIGFEASRRYDDHSLRANEGTWVDDIYRHPERQGKPSRDFHKEDDYYALGALFVEIGYWKPISSIGKFAEYKLWRAEVANYRSQGSGDTSTNLQLPTWTPSATLGAAKEELIRLAKASEFRANVGKIWKEVSLKCLQGDFGVEEDDRQQTKLQIAYRELVVERLVYLLSA